MKFTVSAIALVLACGAMARPRATKDGEPLPEKSRVTAFTINEHGEPSIECWEISAMVESSQIQRADGSMAAAHALPLARSGELEGLDILTWPAYSPIWPPPGNDMQTKGFDLANGISLFSVQGGLIRFNPNPRAGSAVAADDEDETHIFSLENGDDWFYFEDSYTGSSLARSADAKPYPFAISTISATETEVLRLRYNSRPKHRVVHKGSCSFTGLKVPPGSSGSEDETSRAHSPFTVQVHFEDL